MVEEQVYHTPVMLGVGRKAGRAGGQSGARRGRDRSPGRSGPPSDELPSPSMRQLAPVRAACVFSTVARLFTVNLLVAVAMMLSINYFGNKEFVFAATEDSDSIKTEKTSS